MKRFFYGILSAAVTIVTVSGEEFTEQRIFSPDVKTLKVEVDGDFMSPSVITLGSGQQICVSFDELTPGRDYMRYSLTHCNADWQPSDLIESEYLPSFNEAEVTDYGFSTGVFRNYENYRICLPNQDMQPLVSGNYLLKVWREDEEDSPLLQARFSVSEQAVNISGTASSLTDRGNNDKWQQLSFSIDPGRYRINDPYNELIIKIEQNGIDVTPTTGLRPLRVEGNKLVYEHNQNLIFPAGNEFRRFETVRTDYQGMHIASNKYEGDGYTATLTEDTERASRPYTYDRTQFGRFKIDEYSASDPNLGADYVETVFTLDFPQVTNGDIILDGEFVRSLPIEERKLNYDPSTGKYSKTMLLKQGSYNYRYAAISKSKDAAPVPALIEGDKYETRNEFTVKVYHRAPGSRYDRLLDTATIITSD
ncbi:MAG: DUF5103 domain-containing protein [Lachnospiraceae bacterium]|nr:DUF5103 domain-containing protein [Lachnospiraceae bacterium]